jgi:GntR family transcriptional regulator of vanillate catabolism
MNTVDRLTIDSFSLYLDINEAFHEEIRRLAKNEILNRALEQVFSLPFASPSAMVFPTSVMPRSTETLAIAQEHPRAIMEALEPRHGTRAEALAREHALLARRVLDVALSDHDALSTVPGGPLINLSLQ